MVPAVGPHVQTSFASRKQSCAAATWIRSWRAWMAGELGGAAGAGWSPSPSRHPVCMAACPSTSADPQLYSPKPACPAVCLPSFPIPDVPTCPAGTPSSAATPPAALGTAAPPPTSAPAWRCRLMLRKGSLDVQRWQDRVRWVGFLASWGCGQEGRCIARVACFACCNLSCCLPACVLAGVFL